MHRKHRIPRLVFDHGIRRYKRKDNTICSNTRSGIQSNMHHSNNIISSYSIPIGCSVALLLLGLICINPVVGLGGGLSNGLSGLFSNNDSVYAAKQPTPCLTTDPDCEEAEESDATSLSLTIGDGNVSEISVNGSTGRVNTMQTGFTVNASNVDGYQVFVQTVAGSSNVLTQGNTSLTGVGKAQVDGFSDNTWGYAIAADTTSADANTLTYSTVPMNGDATIPAYSTTNSNSAADGDKFTLAFAAKFADDATAGHYSTNILLSVAAGAGEVVTGGGFSGIKYMHQMTHEICTAATENYSKQLIDVRDNKTYWVSKLRDGHCWMTQNLALDLWVYDGPEDTEGHGRILTSADSDLPSNGETINQWVSTTGPSSLWGGSDDNTVKYYNGGDYIYTTPLVVNTCNGAFSDCSEKGWRLAEEINNTDISNLINTQGWTSANSESFINDSTYIGTDNKTLCYKTSGSMIGDANFEQCRIYYYAYENAYRHYSAGNYYSWLAASLGHKSKTEPTVTSICPKGWRLPTATSNGEYSILLDGLAPTLIISDPYYFLPAGYVGYNNYSGNGAGYYRSSTVVNSTSNSAAIFQLSLTTSNLHYSTSSARYLGQSVRCIAK